MQKIYPAKVLLFGEYTVLKGSQALAMPFPHFGGQWQFSAQGKALQQRLQEWAATLLKLQREGKLLSDLDVEAFQNDLQNGLSFQSNIPTGYGLGSSGALCAGLYDCYSTDGISPDYSNLKNELAQLESFFHGSSSGLDPLICLLNQAMLTGGEGKMKAVELPSQNGDGEGMLFLLDSEKSRKTGPLVQKFFDRCQNVDYEKRIFSELVPLADDAIHAFLQGDLATLFDAVHQISHFQFKYFEVMVLPEQRAIWLEGLAGDAFKLKLCGAGGGGFVLGVAQDWAQTKLMLSDYKLLEVFRF